MIASGDVREWFEREVVAMLPELLGTARRLAKNSADAEDLVAEAVAKAWAALPTLHDRASFRGWLFRILTNTYLSDQRSRAVQPLMESLGQGNEEQFSIFERLHQPFLLWWGSQERDFLDRLLREDLECAIDALPEIFRLVVVMADLEDLSYQETASALDIPIGTVRSRLARGRALLQRALWEHAIDAGLAPPDSAAPAKSHRSAQ
jgi:RNA polymerase sigma-70 factor (ECF subfamily)